VAKVRMDESSKTKSPSDGPVRRRFGPW